ncbi:class IV adenylate cyclase [archaeon]|jgi:adenylate cyclase, class 2|nr:class IV adenylate cyclase [archaeon]
MWLEVETKARVKDPINLRKKIKSIAKLDKKETRTDKYFAIKNKLLKKKYPKKAFRIREKPNKFEINFKKKIKELSDKEIVVKKEFEFSIKEKKDIENLSELFKDLNFEEWVEKTKITESYKYRKNKNLTIELHKVKSLGYFLEIEYLCQEKEVEKAKQLINTALKELEINKKDIDNTGYTKMLWSLK